MKSFWRQIRKTKPPALGFQQWILISSAFSILLLAIRIIVSHRISYAFLAWNLFLAYIPLMIANWLNRHEIIMRNKISILLSISVWLLFLPNSFYILTDLFHLQNLPGSRPWFDLILILSFAWNGILFGIISIWKMEMLLKRTTGRLTSTLLIFAVMWLNAFGVYIGRFLRFNSWDIIFNPFPLFTEIFDMIINPYDYKTAWAMCLCLGCFISILYYTMKRLTQVLKNS
jgi:uncharacterized membrane protein